MSFPLRLRLRLWWLATAVPFKARRQPLLRLMTALMPPAPEPSWHPPPDAVVRRVRAAVARPWRRDGRRRLGEALLAFHFLRRAGHPAVLHFGIDRSSIQTMRIRGHCWVTLGGDCLLNPPDPALTEFFRFDGRPTLQGRPPGAWSAVSTVTAGIISL